MRKTTAVIIAIILASTTLHSAQILRGYGVKAGVMSALMKETYKDPDFFGISGPPELHRRIGAGAGAYCEWLNLPAFSLVTQLEYRAGGVGHEVWCTDENGNILGSYISYARIDHIALCVLAKARVSRSVVSPYVMVGPRFDHVLGWNHNGWTNLFDHIDKDIAGLTFGGGTELARIIPLNMLVEFRYDIDLSDSYDDHTVTVRKNSFGAWLGVGF